MAVKSSYMQLLQYVTAALLVILVSWHLALRLPWLHGVDGFIQTLMPEVVYREITSFSLVLLLLAYTALIHGVNGLRIILLEVHHGELWDKAVNAAAVLTLLVFGALATYTVVGVEPPL